MAPRDHTITLVTKSGCHLCDDARDVLARLAAELGVPVDERDVLADAELADEYADRVPVVLLDGREHSYWNVDERRLRADLTR